MDMDKNKILIVDDDDDIRNALKQLLLNEGYMVVEASSGEEALDLADSTFDLIILDIMLSEIDGISVCIEIRRRHTVPVLFLTAKSTEYDKYIGFSVGGDDYISKPFSKVEFLARISAILRRYHVYKGKDSSNTQDNYIIVKDLKIDKNTSRVFKEGHEIILTNIEYGILSLLAQNPGKIFTLENLYESIWKEPYDYSVNATIMVHIKNLRRKLNDTSKSSIYIKNVWGRGYCIAN